MTSEIPAFFIIREQIGQHETPGINSFVTGSTPTRYNVAPIISLNDA
jgi:hypothetical protein